MGYSYCMTLKNLLLFLLLFIPTAHAADVNGYTAKYECKAGGTYCNVDVATYTAAACQQTITTGAAWSTINWSNNVICLANGDHTAKGTLTLGSSGTSGTRKVLRYYRASDTDDEPWNQSAGNRATIKQLAANGVSYWIIHRITTHQTSNDYSVSAATGSSNIIFNRVYDYDPHGGEIIYINNASDITVQNSVLTDAIIDSYFERIGVSICDAPNTHIVNNEIYDYGAHNVQIGPCSPQAGYVFENNDLYESPAMYTNCSGTYTPSDPDSPCVAVKTILSLKDYGTSISPTKVIHNRFWGGRFTDGSINGDGASGSAVAMGTGGVGYSNYILFQNNLVFDSQSGIEWTMWFECNYSGNYDSNIGNIYYRINNFKGGATTSAAWWAGCGGVNTNEFYLNTLIDVDAVSEGSFGTNNDFRCNVSIDSGAYTTGGSGTQIDYNVYYGSTDSGETHKLGNYTLSTRANLTVYSLGAIIRTGAVSGCTTATDTACFLYKVTTAGTSAGSYPGYTTTLGGSTTDGTMVVKAIRGPYSFKRKLRTVSGGETFVIPYAKAHTSVPEKSFCPSTYADRTGIGIGDE